jgi:hypothetical protein
MFEYLHDAGETGHVDEHSSRLQDASSVDARHCDD